MEYMEYNEDRSPKSIITIVLAIVWVLALVFWIVGLNRPPVETDAYEANSVMNDPVQIRVSSKDPFTMQLDSIYSAKIFPRATYKMTAKVKCVGTLNLAEPLWRKEISKYDLSVVWGKLSDPYYDQFITYSHANRYLTWTYRSDIGLSHTYLSTHVANNHTIPANDNVLKGLSKIKVNDIVYLEGTLVDYEIYDRDKYVTRLNTSMVRSDGGNGACEEFYITKVMLGDETFE